MRIRTKLATLLLGLIWLGLGQPARGIDTLPVGEIRTGMQGVAHTVFQGNTVEEFGIEVIGVFRRARPHGDLILFRGLGERLEHLGIAQGMSGSPVYIDGKLVGAIAFAYPGSMDPIGAITPIGEMLPLLEGEVGPGKPGAYPSFGDMASPGGEADGRSTSIRPGGSSRPDDGETPEPDVARFAGGSGIARGTGFDFEGVWQAFTRPGPAEGAFGGSPSRGTTRTPDPGAHFRPQPVATSPQGLAPIGTPVSFSGWDPSLHGDITRAFSLLGFAASPVTGGGLGSGSAENDERLVPGSAIGLRMIGGDADVVAIGTVTHVEGDELVAFGHPMIQAGEVTFPMTGAWIHTVLANRSVSMKMGSSTGLLGGIWNDRRTGIAGRHGEVPPQLPVAVEIRADDGDLESFRYTVARHPFLTPFFLPWTVTNSYLASGWVTGNASIRTETDVFFSGGEHLRRIERISADAPGSAVGADITLPAVLLAINPWEPIQLDSLHVRVEYERGNPGAEVRSVGASQRRARVGDVVTITAELEPFRGQPLEKTFLLEIPPAWAGRSLRVHVGATSEFTAWDQDRVPEKFVPHSLRQMVEMIERMPDDSYLTLRVYDGIPGALLQGVELPDLPPSVVGVVQPTPPRPGGLQGISASLLEERHEPTDWVLTGGATVLIEVASQ